MRRLSAYCSRACAHQPATRPTAKIDVQRSPGIPTLYAYVSRGALRSYRQGMRRQRLYRRIEVDALRRLQPSAGARAPAAPEIPLAESWIRE